MHRKGTTAKEFYELLDYLEDMDQLNVKQDPNNKRSKLVTLKKHMLTDFHQGE